MTIDPDDPDYSHWKQQHRQHLLDSRFTDLAAGVFEAARIALGATDTLQDRRRQYLALPAPRAVAPIPMVLVIQQDEVDTFRELMERAHDYGVVEAKRLDLFDRLRRAYAAYHKECQRKGSTYDSRARAFFRAMFTLSPKRDAAQIRQELSDLITGNSIPWRYRGMTWQDLALPTPKGAAATDQVQGPMSKTSAIASITWAWPFPSRESARRWIARNV